MGLLRFFERPERSLVRHVDPVRVIGGSRAKIAVVTMVKNEIDIIDDFLAHHLPIVDRIYVADHLSSDGTFELLQARARTEKRIRVLRFDYEQHFQGAVVTAVSRQAVDDGADWIFPLDADEFLPFREGEALRSAVRAADSEIVTLAWANLVPEPLPESVGPVDWSRPFLTLPDFPASTKTAFSAELVRLHKDFVVGEGSHHVSFRGKGPTSRPRMSSLVHLPIRSLQQAHSKFRSGAASMAAIHRREAKLGSHWDVFTKVYEGGITPRDAQSMALQYEKKDYVDVVDQAVPMIFEPNGRFSGSVEKVPSMNRTAKHSKLMMTEVIGVVRDEVIELRARPMWRVQRLGHHLRWAPAGLRRRVAAARGKRRP